MTNAQVEMLAGFDLEALDSVAEATYKCGVVFDEEGEAKAGFILVSKNSTEYVQVAKQIRIANIQRSSQRKKNIDATTESGATTIADTVEANDRKTALAIIVGWFGFNRGGKPAPFDKSMVPAMLDKSPQWQTKVLNDLESEANFLPVASQD